MCLATASCGKAFVVPAGVLRSNALTTRGQSISIRAYTKCTTSRPTRPRKMHIAMGTEPPSGSKRAAVRRAAEKMQFWRRSAARPRKDEETVDGGIVGGARARESRGWVRKGLAGAAAAVVIRTSFAPSQASAVPVFGMDRKSPQVRLAKTDSGIWRNGDDALACCRVCLYGRCLLSLSISLGYVLS